MTEAEIRTAILSLLVNIGRLADRTGGGFDHGRAYLEGCGIDGKLLDMAGLVPEGRAVGETIRDPALCMISAADEIAASSAGGGKNSGRPDPQRRFESIYNLLNLDGDGPGIRREKKYYSAGSLDGGIMFPLSESELEGGSDDDGRAYRVPDRNFYRELLDEIAVHLKALTMTVEYLSSLTEFLEVKLSFVPAFCQEDAPADISMYDHMKMSAALACAMSAYFRDRGVSDISGALEGENSAFRNEKAFVMFSMDLCGIQDFIYTITSDKALKTLRSRSFYLELSMEHMIDSLLADFGLSRLNMIYSGGGHCYLLLPNLRDAGDRFRRFCQNMNRWLIATFDISLFLSSGYALCSAGDLANTPEGSFRRIFVTVGDMISEAKLHRYSASDLRSFNRRKVDDHTRECRICKRMGRLDQDSKCSVCVRLEDFSNRIQNGGEFFAVLNGSSEHSLMLPGDCCLVAMTEAELEHVQASDPQKIVRVYSKNRTINGHDAVTRLWVGDYFYDRVMENLAREAGGIERVAVLRADVDNLGQTFVRGFESARHGQKYVNLARTAALSRSLSMFFKYHINSILRRSDFTLAGKSGCCRKVTVVYSGGDDVFLIGAWDDVIGCAVDLSRSLERYTMGTLTISAGIGVYSPSYPVSAAALETAEYEDASKRRPGKAAATLFSDGAVHESDGIAVDDGTFSWQELEQDVVGQKYRLLEDFFRRDGDDADANPRGNGFLYRILELVRARDENVNFQKNGNFQIRDF